MTDAESSSVAPPAGELASRALVVGLDCAPPALVFEELAGELPHLSALRARGQWGPLASITPPITVPAWAAMLTGQDAGRLGVYGFRNRTGPGYRDWGLADATWIRESAVWDYLGQAGDESIVVGVPPGYPVLPLRGCRVGCFLTPAADDTTAWTWPRELAHELEAAIGAPYLVDVSDFRTSDKAALLERLFEQSRRQFAAFRWLLGHRPWRLAMMVNIALDRLHHGFWRYFDRRHRFYEEQPELRAGFIRFYRHLDEEIGRLAALLRPRDLLLVVSDHGARPIDGGIAINQWLIDRGYLVVHEMPAQPTPLGQLSVDWGRTRAWSEGGYYARVFINRQGREPQGVVSPSEYEGFRRRLAEEIAAIPDDAGQPLATRVLTPEEAYADARGLPPDLLVFFGDLAWRSIGSVGHPRVQVLENDTGPDDANHDWQGIYVAAGAGVPQRGGQGRSLLDIAPTLLRWLQLPIPTGLRGVPLW